MKNNDSPKYLRVDVAGQDERLWTVLRHKLIIAINKLLDSEIDAVHHTTLKEEAQKFTSALLDYGKNKLLKPGIDNEKTIAEIEQLYSQKQKNLAEARKINAETDAIELATRIKKLRFIMETAKLIVTGNEGDESLLFIKNIDNFLLAVGSIEQNDTSMT